MNEAVSSLLFWEVFKKQLKKRRITETDFPSKIGRINVFKFKVKINQKVRYDRELTMVKIIETI